MTNRVGNATLLFLVLLSSAALVWAVSPGDDANENVTLVGTLVEADWDDDGEVIAVELDTEDGVFVIDLSEKGAELIALAGEKVEISGTVYDDEDGWTHLVVVSFKVISSFE
jgi:hypothetical protein